jgi:hypothetical protein
MWYSLVSPSRIGLRRTWWSARLITWGLGLGLGWGELCQRSVGPRCVEMVQVDPEDPAQVAFVDDQDSVEQLPVQRSDHAFADRVRSRRPRWTGQDPNAVRGEDRIERPGEPGISIAEQELHGGGTVAEVHQQVAGGLSGPRTGRVRRHPEKVRPAGTMLEGTPGGNHARPRSAHRSV